MVRKVIEKNFKEKILGSHLPVPVCFYLPWCDPYNKVYPIVKKLAEKFTGKFKFYMLDIVKAQKIARKYEIIRTPTLIFFRRRKVLLKLSLL
ncbi:MAG: thiol reductase thioredoxin [Deltaproteobacteria bacterium]|nr:thiol reductase thioredoxin [Deltaproteobacteria bacterium]